VTDYSNDIHSRLITTGADGISYGDTFWDDIRVPLTASRAGGAKIPGFSVFLTNGAGSQGVYVNWFDAGLEEELFFAVQLPHNYKHGTDLHPHVHWVPKSGGALNAVVNWGLEYTIQQIGSTYGNTTIISSNAHIPAADTTLVASRHYLTGMGTISGSSINSVSAMLIGRIFRDATGALGTDDYADDAGALEFDLHYEIDYPGSRDEYTK
jgi:hypothetical protein